MASHGLIQREGPAPECAGTAQYQVKFWETKYAVRTGNVKRRRYHVLDIELGVVNQILEVAKADGVVFTSELWTVGTRELPGIAEEIAMWIAAESGEPRDLEAVIRGEKTDDG